MEFDTTKTLVLSREDIHHIVQKQGIDPLMDELIERLAAAIAAFDPAVTEIPARSGFHYDTPHTGLIEWMPVHQKGAQIVVKMVGYHPGNPSIYNVPTILSTISAYDTATGHLIGLIDGVLPTALRTGAASAVASRWLAYPGSRTLGLIGCGAQAVTQLHALSRLFPLERVLLYDVDISTQESLRERCAGFDLELDFLPASIESIVLKSDIVCTATSIDVGTGPLFSNLETNPRLHINAVGSDFPGKVEVSLDFLERSFVCPDFRDQAVVEGECQRLQPDQIGADIVEVARNPAAFEHVQLQRSVFDSTGWALEDQVVINLFMEYATQFGLGQWVEIESIPNDAKNPYHFLTSSMARIVYPTN